MITLKLLLDTLVEKKANVSLPQSIITSVRFLQTDKVRPKNKITSKKKTLISLKEKRYM